MGGITMKKSEELEERIKELEEKVQRLENTIHYHRKIGEADGFGYWQMG